MMSLLPLLTIDYAAVVPFRFSGLTLQTLAAQESGFCSLLFPSHSFSLVEEIENSERKRADKKEGRPWKEEGGRRKAKNWKMNPMVDFQEAPTQFFGYP